ncbi:hypothetical protein Ancab_002530 [Ancistrocladus abbreviatus]
MKFAASSRALASRRQQQANTPSSGSARNGTISAPCLVEQRHSLGAWRDCRSYKEVAELANAEDVHQSSSELDITKCKTNRTVQAQAVDEDLKSSPELNRSSGDASSSKSLFCNDERLKEWNALRQSHLMVERIFGPKSFGEQSSNGHVPSQGVLETDAFMEDETPVILKGEKQDLQCPSLDRGCSGGGIGMKSPHFFDASLGPLTPRSNSFLHQNVDRVGPSNEDVCSAGHSTGFRPTKAEIKNNKESGVKNKKSLQKVAKSNRSTRKKSKHTSKLCKQEVVDTVLFERKNSVMKVILNRGHKLNCLDQEMLRLSLLDIQMNDLV